MAESDKNDTNGTTSSSGNTGSTGSTNTSSSTNSDNATDEAIRPDAPPPVAANTGASNTDNASQSETNQAKERSLGDEPKVEKTKEKEALSLATELKHAREQAISMGLNDATQIENYATSVANKNMMGIKVNPIDEVRNVAGPMAAAVAQANQELQHTTKIAMSDHSFVGNGNSMAIKQQSRGEQLTLTA